jgi:hypothetical protein
MPASTSLVNDVGRECSRCKIFKSWDQFYAQSRGINGHSPRCSACAIALVKAAYIKRPPRPDVACQVCGKVIPGRTRSGPTAMYCSDPCKRSGSEARRWRVPVVRICRHCGDPLKTKAGPLTCPRCRVDKRDPEKARAKERHRTLRKYGLSEREYIAMLNAQGGRCAICSTAVPGGPHGVWAIDHDHATRAVRALLCHNCNLGLGQFDDDPEMLERAAVYLRRYRRPKAV